MEPRAARITSHEQASEFKDAYYGLLRGELQAQSIPAFAAVTCDGLMMEMPTHKAMLKQIQKQMYDFPVPSTPSSFYKFSPHVFEWKDSQGQNPF